MSDLIGQRLGQYEIVSVLGRGGMATVYRAQQVSVKREVAVKVISPDLVDSEDFVARFSREAQTIASLSHPHIVKLFDFGQQEKMSYLVTELLPGGTLAELVQQGPLSLDRIDQILQQIAPALDYAHQQGIVHRDLKPHNILLDSHGNTFLTDFGLARLVAGSASVTKTGLALGTPAYMSPEAWIGNGIDSRSDLYALGIMLYEMLTGRLPFYSDSPYHLMMQHINEPPPHLETLPEEVSPQFDLLIQQTLAKSPADRPASAHEIASAFHGILAGEQIESLKYSTPQQLRAARYASELAPMIAPPAKQIHTGRYASELAPMTAPLGSRTRSRLPLIAAAVALLVIAVVVLFAIRPGAGGTTTPTSVPVADVIKVTPASAGEYIILVAQPQQFGKQPRDITRIIINNLTETLETSIPFSNLHIREYPKVITSADEARNAADANKALVVVWGSVTDSLIDLQLQVGSMSAIPHNKIAEDTLHRFSDIHVQMTDPLAQSLAVPILVIANAMHTADGDVYEVFRTLAMLDQLQSTTTSATVVGNSVAAQMYHTALLYLKDTQKYIDQMGQIIDLYGSNPIAYSYRSIAYFRAHQYDKALQDAESAKRLGPEGWASPLYEFVTNDLINRNYAHAIPIMDQILQAHPDDTYGLTARASLNYFLGKIDAAKVDLDRALALGPNSNSPYIMSILLAIRQGRIADARQLISVVLTKFPDPSYAQRIFDVSFGDAKSSKVMYGLMLTASTNLSLGQYNKVIDDTNTAISIDPTQPDLFLMQGFAYCNLSKWAEAEKAYSSGLDLDPNYAVLYALRAEVRQQQGNGLGALSDIVAMKQIKGSEELNDLVSAAQNGGSSTGTPSARLGCQSLFAAPAATPAR